MMAYPLIAIYSINCISYSAKSIDELANLQLSDPGLVISSLKEFT